MIATSSGMVNVLGGLEQAISFGEEAQIGSVLNLYVILVACQTRNFVLFFHELLILCSTERGRAAFNRSGKRFKI